MPAELAGGLGAIGLYALPGYGLTELFPSLRRLPWPRRAAYGYLLGVGAVAGTLYLLSHAFAVPLRAPAVWAAAAAPALAGLAAALARRRPRRRRTLQGRESVRRQERQGDGSRRPPLLARLAARLSRWIRHLGGALPAACVLAAALVCLGVFAEAIGNPIHDWDGRMTWSAQARYLRDAGTVDAEVLRNARWYVSHPQYPLLLPVAQVAALEALGADADSHLQRALYAAFLPALLLIVYDGARRGAGRTAAALAVLAAVAVPFFTYGEGGAFSTYSDLPLACFFGAATVLLLAPRPALSSGLAAGLLLAAAALTKNEGPLLAALALALGWRGGRWLRCLPGRPPGNRRPPRAAARWLAAVVPLLLALALLASWRAGIPNRQDESYPDLVKTGQLWPGVVTHVAVFGPILLRQMLRFHHWAGFWWMVPAVLIAGRRALRHPLNRRLLAAAAGPPAIGWVAYSIHWDPAFLSSVTWERFLLQASAPLLIVLATALAEVGRHLRRDALASPAISRALAAARSGPRVAAVEPPHR
jgi:hypothetical protein